jgi:phospholipid/cholesterol/gamma-HCH transport system substrate-binding protein
MKYAREIKVGVLAALCLFLLFFGFNFLKGVNIFSPTNSYHGRFDNIHGVEEQAAVYIRGLKVGQVDRIHYDFTADSAFVLDISINRDIVLPQGTQMALVADGLLGGMAIELQLGDGEAIDHGSFLPTVFVPGLVESLQGNLLAHIDEAVSDVDSLVLQLQNELAGNHIQTTLQNVDRISGDLTGVSSDLKYLMKNQVPTIVNNADTAVANLNTVVADLKEADLKSTVKRVDNAVDGVNALISDVRSDQGTIGKLIYDKSLYNHIDATVISADSLLTDLKAHPKRYVQISVFGKKEK